MGVLVKTCLLLLLFKSYICIEVLTTPKTDSDDGSTDAFTRINVSTPELSNVSACQWMSKLLMAMQVYTRKMEENLLSPPVILTHEHLAISFDKEKE